MKPTNQRSGGFAPPFKDIHSRLYRAEYAAASIAIVYYMGWRTFNGGGVDGLQVVFLAFFPDLAAFAPIAITSERRVWPSWGGNWYNLFHSFLIWGAVFTGFWLVIGAPYVPLLGWLLHITTDRAAGYYLRANGPANL